MGHLVEPLQTLDAAVLQGPELSGERSRGRLHQGRQIEVVGAEAHAELAQRCPRLLRQVLHLVGDLGALQHAQRFGDLESDATDDAFLPLALLQLGDRAEQLRHVLREPQVEAPLHEGPARGRSAARRQ